MAAHHDHTAQQHQRHSSKHRQQASGLEILHQVHVHKAHEAKQHHRHDVVALRQHLGGLLAHPLSHENTRAILDDKGPAGNLCAHIEELRHHTVAVGLVGKQPPEGRPQGALAVGTALLTHGRDGQEQHDDQQRYQHYAQQGIGLNQDAQVTLLQRLKASVVEGSPLRRVQGGKARLDIVHRHKHARQRPDGVERLRQRQAPCGSLAVTHEQDIGVGRRL